MQNNPPAFRTRKVIGKASAGNLIILTFDKDYGEIIFKFKKSVVPSVVYFRFKGKEPSFAGEILVELIAKQKMSFDRVFTVIENENVRQRHYN